MTRELIEAGLREHRAGRLADAQSFYERALGSEPRNPDALHLLGVILLQRGDATGAAALIEQAVAENPGHPGFQANLARAYLALDRVGEARSAFQRACALDPREPQFALGAATCLSQEGRFAEAERAFREIVRAHPDFAHAWLNLGNSVRDQGRIEEAAEHYRRAIALAPGYPDAWQGLGTALHALERFEEAEGAYRRFLAIQPSSPAGYCNLAGVLIDRGRFGEAIAVCDQGAAQSQDSAELRSLLGTALAGEGRMLSALEAFRTATALAPDNARMAAAFGAALCESGRLRQGMREIERALALEPENPDFRYLLAGICLKRGAFEAGWDGYGWRPARSRFVAHAAATAPVRELPAELSGVKVCLLCEQGLGDELFFLRFTAALASRGAKITCHASAKIASLLERVRVLDRVATRNDPAPDADLYVMTGDLPHALGRLPSSPRRQEGHARAPAGSEMGLPRALRVFFPEIPPALALAPLPQLVESARKQLARLGPPPYLGLTWRAGTAPEAQRGAAWSLHKEIPPRELAGALCEANGTLIALQRNPQPGEIEELSARAGRPVHDLTALNEELEAMLALLSLLDDYVGVSNTNMHLRAGAGRTARVLVPRPAEWRWMAVGEESPWFPGFRTYRQGLDGSWNGALARLRDDLAPRQSG